MAVRISIGLEAVKNQPRKINFTQKYYDKTSGWNIPRNGDYDVIPAPDSTVNVSWISVHVLSEIVKDVIITLKLLRPIMVNKQHFMAEQSMLVSGVIVSGCKW